MSGTAAQNAIALVGVDIGKNSFHVVVPGTLISRTHAGSRELREAPAGVKADHKTRAEITELADTLRDNLDKIVQHGRRANSIVKNMLLHSREGSGEHRPVDINALVEEAVNLAYHGARAEKQGIQRHPGALVRPPIAGEVDCYPAGDYAGPAQI